MKNRHVDCADGLMVFCPYCGFHSTKQVPSIDGKPWYEVAMTRGQPFGSLEGQVPPVAVTKELLEEIGKEILALYVTRSNGGDFFTCTCHYRTHNEKDCNTFCTKVWV